MRTPERIEKDALEDFLNTLPRCYEFNPVQIGYGKRTVDKLACINGRFWGIECKKKYHTGPLPPRQRRILDDIEAAGGMTAWGSAEKCIGEIKAWLSTTTKRTTS
jgi:hypothetical protein